ncbi:AbrB family transcriptional regulator [Robertmurraya korlensis]|uniref:AbrB family transcriptional regulator n=1 Tax=Robertmurraya korlensis TaxID=519977 RepID=UPI00203D2BDF|nr:AbrB family transcriptional regulator [Robertmurraya korlensis]MCM3600426.1 AbrB family transcriptional regulator [Robertmurraya korlensis]
MAIAKSYLLTALLGVIGAYAFQLFHIPMPWLLGPLLTILVLKLTTQLPLKWNKHFRNFGLVIAGYSIGHAFTLETLADIRLYLPVMILLNVLYIILFIFISWVIAKRVKVDQLTALTSCVPGGMTQIVAYAEEQGNKNITLITFYQVLRVICIIGFVPLLVVASSISGPSVSNAHYTFSFLLFFVLSYIAGFIAMKIKIPTGYMLGPVFLFMGLQLAKIQVPEIPVSALHVAQIVMGIYIGLLMNKENLQLSKKMIFYAFVSSFLYIASAFGLALLMMQVYPLDFKTSFLSIVPGGLDQMGIISASVHADSTLVTAFQLFRVLVISIAIVPSIKYLTSKIKSHDA